MTAAGDGNNLFIAAKKIHNKGKITSDGGKGSPSGNARRMTLISDDITNLGTISAAGGDSLSFNASTSSLLGEITTIDQKLTGLISSNLSPGIEVAQNIQPLVDASNVFKESLSQFNKVTIESGLMDAIPQINFGLDPINSSLGIALDTLDQQKSVLTDAMNSLSDAFQLPGNIVNDLTTLTESVKLNDLALGSIEASIISPSVSSLSSFSSPSLLIDESDDEMRELNERIEDLESKVKDLKKERNHRTLSLITEKVILLLREFSDELGDRFNSVCLTIFNGENCERIPHAAESMTRIIEDLPMILGDAPDTVGKSKENAAKFLGKFLKLDDTAILCHKLIAKQHEFYDVFSGIRHRNPSRYLTDINMFEALLLQAEAYIYELLTEGTRPE